MNRIARLAGVCCIAWISGAAVSASTGWDFGVVPYLWLPSVEGNVRYFPNGGASATPDVNVGDNLLENLSAAFMIGADASKDRWVIMSDFIYMDFGSVGSDVKSVNFNAGSSRFDPISTTLNTQTQTTLTGIAWTLNGGYRVLEGSVDLDVMGGVRYFGLESTTNWALSAAVQGPGPGQVFPKSGTISDRSDLWDGLFAIRGRVNLGKSLWYLPYYADVGTGSSHLTWQVFGGVAYAFKWLDLSLSYRHISYDVGDDTLIQGLTFTGPALSFKIHF